MCAAPSAPTCRASPRRSGAAARSPTRVRDWRDARDKPSVRLTVGALVLATQTGGPPARVIEDVASAIRSRQQVAREAHALAAQARLSALVVGVAPLGFMVITCLTDPRNAHVLFGTPVGITCVVAGLGLDALGAMWMHRMSKSVASMTPAALLLALGWGVAVCRLAGARRDPSPRRASFGLLTRVGACTAGD